MEQVDYKKLLMKYMQLVRDNESITYLDNVGDKTRSHVTFDEKEMQELRLIEQELPPY